MPILIYKPYDINHDVVGWNARTAKYRKTLTVFSLRWHSPPSFGYHKRIVIGLFEVFRRLASGPREHRWSASRGYAINCAHKMDGNRQIPLPVRYLVVAQFLQRHMVTLCVPFLLLGWRDDWHDGGQCHIVLFLWTQCRLVFRATGGFRGIYSGIIAGSAPSG